MPGLASPSTCSNTISNSSAVKNKFESTKKVSSFLSNKCLSIEEVKKLNINDVAVIISSTISDIIEGNNTSKNNANIKQQAKTPFFSKVVPNITIEAYIQRVIKYTRLEVSSLVLMSVYIDSFCELNGFLLTKHNIFRVLITAALIAIKYNEDKIYIDSHYAKVGGIPLEELNILEFSFLNGLDYNLYVEEETYELLHNYLVSEIDKFNSKKNKTSN